MAVGRLESRWVNVGGLKMHTRVSTGPHDVGPPDVVLVHGVGVSGRYMVPTAERLAGRCRVYVPDLPGFGESDKPARVLTLRELADALACWCGAVGLTRAAFLGNSLGCQVIVELALRHAALLDRAIFVGPTMDPAAQSILQLAGRAALDLIGEPWSLWGIVVADYLKAGPVRTWRTLQDGLRDPVERKLGRVHVPTLVVEGSRDPIVPRRWAAEMVRRLPDARLVVLRGAPHAINYSRPDALARLVTGFLAEPAGHRPRAGRAVPVAG